MAESHPESDATDAPAESPQDLVQDVLREARALLDEPDATASDAPAAVDASPAVGPTAETGETEETREVGESVDVEGLVARVDSLLGDLGHLVEDVESAEDAGSDAGLDLTLVLPTPPPAAEDLVPDHGAEGPQVDLFAVPPESEPASEATPPSPPVMLETETPTEATPPASAAPTSAEGAMLDDLASALAEEFDQPTLAPASDGDSKPGSKPGAETGAGTGAEAHADTESEADADAATSISPREAAMEDALLEAMAEEFGQEPAELPPVEDEGDPFASSSASSAEPSEAARRLEALLADRLAEEFELVEQAATTTPTVIESQAEEIPTPAQPGNQPETPPADQTETQAESATLAQSDIDAVARAEMEALEALGSNLETDLETGSTPTPSESTAESTAESTPERPVEPDTETFAPVEPSESAATASATEAEAAETSPSPVEPVAATEVEAEAASTPDTPSASEHDASEPTAEPTTEPKTEPEATTETTSEGDPADDADATTDRPRPTRTGPSTLVRLGAAPFRFIPRGLHRHATPVALSLVAWVPLAWGFALLAPTPEPATIDVLRAGFEPGFKTKAETGSDTVNDDGVRAAADPGASATSAAVDADHAEP